MTLIGVHSPMQLMQVLSLLSCIHCPVYTCVHVCTSIHVQVYVHLGYMTFYNWWTHTCNAVDLWDYILLRRDAGVAGQGRVVWGLLTGRHGGTIWPSAVTLHVHFVIRMYCDHKFGCACPMPALYHIAHVHFVLYTWQFLRNGCSSSAM